MELKFVIIWFKMLPCVLLIEPLWNWNQETVCNNGWRCKTFNRTFVELKCIITTRFRSTNWPFNRTFVELKYANANLANVNAGLLLIEPLWNWNSEHLDAILSRYVLLIEPLWNWNRFCGQQQQRGRQAFNRTFVELKSPDGGMTLQEAADF